MSNARASKLTLLSTVVSLLLAAAFLARIAPLRTLLERVLWPALLAVPTGLAALGLGCTLRLLLERALGQRTRTVTLGTSTEDFVVGLPLYGTLCFVVACVDARPQALALPLVFCAALGVVALRSALRAPRRVPELPAVAIVALAVAVLVAITLAQLPPITLDEVAYHLAVPRAWLIEGRVVELPLNSHSYFPFGVESAALPLLAGAGHGGAMAFHFVVLASFVAALALAASLAQPLGSQVGAGLAVLAIASTPALLLTAGTAWIDAPLVALTLGLARALSRAHRRDYAKASLASVALFVAAGALTKYTWASVLVVTFGAALVATRLARTPFVRLALCALGGLVLGSAFFVRNAVWTGNPVAPFLDPSAPHVAAFNGGDTAAAMALNYLYDPVMVDESLGALLFALSLLVPVVLRELAERPYERALAVLALLGLAAVGALGAAGRLLTPFAALAATLAAAGLARALSDAPRPRRLALAVSGAVAALQLAFVITAVAQYEPLALLGGHEVEHLTRQRPLTPAIRFLDAHLPDGSRTLVLGIHESYWFEHAVRTGGNFDGPRVAAYLRADSPAALAARLKRDGFTHVALYRKHLGVGTGPESGRRAESRTTLSPEVAALLRATLNEHARVIAEGEGTTLLALP